MWAQLKNVRRILPYARPYRRLVVGLWVFTALGAVVALAQPWPFAFIVDSVIGKKGFPGVLQWLGTRPMWVQLAFGVCLTLSLTLISSFITVLTETLGTKLELNVVLEYRSALFAHAQRLSLTYHDTQRKGSFIYQINFHAHSAGSVLTAIPPMVQAALTLLGMFFITFSLDPKLAIVATFVAPALFYSVRYYARYVQTELYRVRNLEGESMSIIHESMAMIWVVVANARERYEHRKFRDQAKTAVGARVRLTVMQTVFTLAVSFVTAVGTGMVIFFGAQAVTSNRITLGELLIVLAYVASIYKPMEQISTTLGSLQETLVNLGLSFDLLDEEVAIQDGPNAEPLPRPQGHVVFDHVSFDYPRRNGVLQDISFDVQPGERVAVVGPTGAGKSTLMSLLARFSDPTSGRILLDGHDLRDLRVDDVRNSLGFVLQEPALFQGSVMENIRYGRLEATDDEVIAAATAAGAHDFIKALPQGYWTQVGERGALLSGGERQRICVARAFVRDAPVLVLDEPTSSIDSRTERTVLDALDRLAAGRTTFVIAHRLSTIRESDRILVLDHGRIVESGRHAELVRAGGLYAALAAAQDAGAGEPPALPAAAAPAPALAPDASGIAAPAVRQRPKVVVLGMVTKIPVAGVVWQIVHYLVGLQRLGVDAYYVEAHARTPSMFMTDATDGSARAAEFLSGLMARIGLQDRWAYHALHGDGQVYGMSAEALDRLYREADIIINLHGGTVPLPEHSASGRLVYLETDPGQLAIELDDEVQSSVAFLEQHCAFFTFAENWGAPDCLLPVSDRFTFHPTRQPVVRDFWLPHGNRPGGAVTTVGNWRQPWREVQLGGETYHWSKHLEFGRFLELPSRVPVTFDLALANMSLEDRRLLTEHGWGVRDALEVSGQLDTYREFITSSLAEFTVAKDQNIRMRTGWFSDRSATYLAAGRPVVTQDTGFGAVLPTGTGLFAVGDVDAAAEALRAIVAEPERHSAAAREIGREYFDHEVVLRPLLETVGVELRQRRRRAERTHVDDDLDLVPRSKRPLVLSEATTAAVLARSLPAPSAPQGSGTRRISVVVVTHDHLAVTRLCVESILANSDHPDVELIVVDNASTDLTPSYLAQLAATHPNVVALCNDHNPGYAAALNQGLAAATGQVYVVMNNDVIVAPGWLHGLAGHLDDPTVGMVGPVTNSAANEAKVDVGYSTYGGFVREARERARSHRRTATEVPMLTLFCAMLRRETYRRVGPFDEQFGLGLFEDDDYSRRLQAAGLRVVVAEDTLVHHFGEASFGDLVPTGEYGALFAANRMRFEAKWHDSWQGHQQRQGEDYAQMVSRVRQHLDDVLPEGAVVAVIAKGDDALLQLDRATAWQFPQGEDGVFGGEYPADSSAAIAALEELRSRGAQYLAVPASSRWWLDHYTGLRDHLGIDYEVVSDDADCTVFRERVPQGRPAWV